MVATISELIAVASLFAAALVTGAAPFYFDDIIALLNIKKWRPV
jgi:hypothetical protein